MFIKFLWNINNINIEKLSNNLENYNIELLKDKLYYKFLSDLNFSLNKTHKNILFQIPLNHSKKMIIMILDFMKKKDSVLFNKKINIILIDVLSIEKDIFSLNEIFKELYSFIVKSDKFIEIYDTGKELESFVKDNTKKEIVKKEDTIMKSLINDFIIKKPKLKTYFPNKEQADLEWLNLEDFYKLYISACDLNWLEIKKANQELVKLFIDNDEVIIKWDNADISFCIKWIWSRNSVIETNYPWAEVFSAPVKNKVNWWIFYPNFCFFKFSWDTVYWTYFEFKDWKLVKFDIKDPNIDNVEKNRLLNVFNDKFDESEGNRFLWELAFWTNINIPVWTKHKLIWEKAFWMHIALWRTYKYPDVYNWNNNATIHWDAIRRMDDWSKVYFIDSNWNSKLIMNDWLFNEKFLPLLSNIQKNKKR